MACAPSIDVADVSTENVDATDCHLCGSVGLPPGRLSRELVVALPDGSPYTAGHTVVVPRRHVARLTGLVEDEHRDRLALTRQVLLDLEADHAPDVFTIGMNDGPAAG